MVKEKIHTCPRCNNEFVATRSTHIYCSNYCRNATNALKNEPRNCAYCGNEFIPTWNAPGRCCSRSCHITYKNNGGIPQHMWVKIKEGRHQSIIHNRVIIRLASLLKWINGYNSLIVKCHKCGEYMSRNKHAQYQLCSVECNIAHENDIRTQRNELSRQYSKGPNGKRLRRIYKAQRRAKEHDIHAERINPFDVFNRDKWICQLCGARTLKSLRGKHHDLSPELDHIIPLSKGGRHTWSNVQCACRKCNHNKSNKMYGQLRIAM